MSELDKYRKLLKEYNKEKDDKKYKELVSFVCKKQLEIMDGRKVAKPHNEDKFQPFRDLLDKIRKDLKLYHRSSHQHPPENLDLSDFKEEE
jgi:hypothetical protein